MDRFHFEREHHACGLTRLAGVDEAGRGPLAGPVVAAAAVLPVEWITGGLPEPLPRRNDSKQLTEKIRELYNTVGGFGHLLWLTFDHADNSEAYETSMRLLAQEVLPKLSELTGE